MSIYQGHVIHVDDRTLNLIHFASEMLVVLNQIKRNSYFCFVFVFNVSFHAERRKHSDRTL